MFNEKQLIAKSEIERSLAQFADSVYFNIKHSMLDEGFIVEVVVNNCKGKFKAVVYFLKSGASFDEGTGMRITISGGKFSKTFNYRKWKGIFIKQ